MKSKSIIGLLAVVALLVVGQAFGRTPNQPDPETPDSASAIAGAASSSSAGAVAGAASGAQAGSIAGGGDSASNATGGRSNATGGRSDATGGRSDATATGGIADGGNATARQGQVARGGDGGQGSGEASANGTVEVGGDQNTYRSRALAVSLPGLVAAPAVPGECRIHTRGIGAFSAGVTGGTKLDKPCLDRQHCLNLADRFAAWGYLEAAARQLATCDGVALSSGEKRVTEESAKVDLTEYPKRDEVIERDKRIVEAVLSK